MSEGSIWLIPVTFMVLIIVFALCGTCGSKSYFKGGRPQKSSAKSLSFIQKLKAKRQQPTKLFIKPGKPLVYNAPSKPLFGQQAPALKTVLGKLSPMEQDLVLSTTQKLVVDAIEKKYPPTLVYNTVKGVSKFDKLASPKGSMAGLVVKITLDAAAGKDIESPDYAAELAQTIMVDVLIGAAGITGWPAVLAGVTATALIEAAKPAVARALVQAAIRDARDLAKTRVVTITDDAGNITALGMPGEGGWVTSGEIDYGKQQKYVPPKPYAGPYMGPSIGRRR